jgi:hypothetical protein
VAAPSAFGTPASGAGCRLGALRVGVRSGLAPEAPRETEGAPAACRQHITADEAGLSGHRAGQRVPVFGRAAAGSTARDAGASAGLPAARQDRRRTVGGPQGRALPPRGIPGMRPSGSRPDRSGGRRRSGRWMAACGGHGHAGGVKPAAHGFGIPWEEPRDVAPASLCDVRSTSDVLQECADPSTCAAPGTPAPPANVTARSQPKLVRRIAEPIAPSVQS